MNNPPALVIHELSLDEKAALTSGASFWTTKALGGVDAVLLTDGPHGLRKQVASVDHLGIGESIPATCFPPGAGLSQTWNPDLVHDIGAALGREAQSEGVGVLLGPGINIKRDPRGGRNFEYYSEDPFLAGALGTAWVRGLQGEGVGASLKHFAANNTEDDRMRSSSDIDERTLREIYLRAFQRVVRDAQPWTVMCSYNTLNGVRVSENRWLLTDVLRTEWGFNGLVVSDWGAVRQRAESIAAGVDLAMPAVGEKSDAAVVDAVHAGTLDSAAVDRAAESVLSLARRVSEGRQSTNGFDVDAHHGLARRAASQAITLLKNDGDVLPLATSESIVVIGEFARTPRYQGGGSSHVNPTRLDITLDELRDRAGTELPFAPGFTTDGSQDAGALLAQAVDLAQTSDVVLLFVGLAAAQESEGFDRVDIELPADQIELVRAVAAVQPNIVLVVSHGSAVRLAPIVDVAPAILDAALLGQGGGAAIADVVFGLVNPSGKLTESVPERVEDLPAFLTFPGENGHAPYGEGLFVGYRSYHKRAIPAAFPFGHGLSYTTFEYSSLIVEEANSGLIVTVSITNTGDVDGREIVQFYAGVTNSRIVRAVRELVGFSSVSLRAGESKTVRVTVAREDLAYWNTRVHGWVVEPGTYEIWAAASSTDLRLHTSVELAGDSVAIPITDETTLGDLMSDPQTAAALLPLLAQMVPGGGDADASSLGTDMMRMMASIPLGMIGGFNQTEGAPDLVTVIKGALGR